jgi:hypothetical protein
MQVNNPFEDDQVVGITNYIDVGLKLATRYLLKVSSWGSFLF